MSSAHPGKDAFHCTHCDFTTSNKLELNQHTVGAHPEERPPFKCDKCDYTSPVKANTQVTTTCEGELCPSCHAGKMVKDDQDKGREEVNAAFKAHCIAFGSLLPQRVKKELVEPPPPPTKVDKKPVVPVCLLYTSPSPRD